MTSHCTHFAPTHTTVPAQPDCRAQVPPAALAQHDRQRLQAAAAHAKRAWPGPIGDALAEELNSAADVGFALRNGSRSGDLAAAVLKTPLPQS